MNCGIVHSLPKPYLAKLSQQLSNPKTYTDAISTLSSDFYSWNGAWIDPLTCYGIRAFDIYPQVTALNHLWSDENNFAPPASPVEAVIQQALKLRLDSLFITDIHIFNCEDLSRLKAELSLKSLILHHCNPCFDVKTIGLYDGVVTCLRKFARILNDLGHRALYLPHCFNSSLSGMGLSSTQKLVNKVFFGGSIVKRVGFHLYREHVINELLRSKVPLTLHCEHSIFSYLIHRFLLAVASPTAAQLTTPILNVLSLTSGHDLHRLVNLAQSNELISFDIAMSSKSPLYGLDLYRAISSHLVTLNVMPEISGNEASNMRMFEVAGLGSVLLTDTKSGISDFFEPDLEVVTYSCAQEATESAAFLLRNPHKASQIALRARERVSRDHTFKNRAALLAPFLESFRF